MRILVHGKDSGERLGLAEMEVQAGFAGPPLHTHASWDEGFYVLAGEMTLRAGAEVVAAKPGTFVFAPRGVPHTFANHTSEDARMLVLFTPAGFERVLAGEIDRTEVEAMIRDRDERRGSRT
jgi:quercetin dioxygenase-like cupin family protein